MFRLKRSALTLAAILLVATTIVTFAVPVGQASAANLSACTSGLSNWNWPSWVAKQSPRTGTVTGGAIPGFDPEKSSYVIVGYDHAAGHVKYDYYWLLTPASANEQLVLKVSGGIQKIQPTNNGGVWKDLISDPNVSAGGSYSTDASVLSNGDASTSGLVNLDYGTGTFSGSCIVVAKNVLYDATWTTAQYSDIVSYNVANGDAGSTSCASGLSGVTCAIGHFFSNVANDILSVFKAFTAALASFFMPDGAQVQADFSNFNSFLQAKLGFLTYPITFIVDVFNAFGHSGTGACSTSGCVRSFGNLFGHNFSIDFALIAETLPTLWAWITSVLIGLTILELLLTIRRKYMGVIHK